uniref:Carbonic anhydrase 4 n=1 Tax=Hucho hucho TaxID=62062 RepID=A0A4W5P1S7_9TELE
PINIVHRKTVPNKRLTPFQFNQYQDSFQSQIKNNGHSGIDFLFTFLQLHIVHMKQQHSNLGDALKDPTGVAVLGFFYEESLRENRKYDPIVKALQSIRKTRDDVSLEQLIPPQQNLTNYYRYKGSLTTPNCTESVIWTVFEKPIPLNLQFKDDKDMVDTFRPVQPLNRRVVYRSGGAVVLASVTLLVEGIPS